MAINTNPPETQLVKACLDYLRALGVFAWRQNQGGIKRGKAYYRFCGASGISDIIGILPGGRFLAIECKRAPNKLTPAQADFLDRVNKAGGVGRVAYLVDDIEGILP